jgi:Resolvase, N terminal domain
VQMEFLTTPAEDTPEGRLLLNVSRVVAEFEREKIKERTLRGKREKARRGLVVASYPYGYKPDPARPGKLLVHDREAEVIQLIYRLCIEEGRSLERIVVELRPPRSTCQEGPVGYHTGCPHSDLRAPNRGPFPTVVKVGNAPRCGLPTYGVSRVSEVGWLTRH